MKYLIHFLIVFSSCFFTADCSRDEAISENELRSKFSIEIVPKYWELSSFDVEVSENVGTKVEPVIKSRFKASLELKANTFSNVGVEEGVVFIEDVAREGEKVDIYGIATAELYAGSWNVNFRIDKNPIPDYGKPQGYFSQQQVIIKGTAEEDSFRIAMGKSASEKKNLKSWLQCKFCILV